MVRRAMLIGGKRTAFKLDSFLQKDGLDGKCAAGGPLAHSAVSHEHLHGSPSSCEANLPAQTATAMDLRHLDSENEDDACCGA